MGEVEPGSRNSKKKHNDGEQIDLPRVMIVVADFPAHCCFPPPGGHHINASAEHSVPRVSHACFRAEAR
jgi:hypothetical protein